MAINHHGLYVTLGSGETGMGEGNVLLFCSVLSPSHMDAWHQKMNKQKLFLYNTLCEYIFDQESFLPAVLHIVASHVKHSKCILCHAQKYPVLSGH